MLAGSTATLFSAAGLTPAEAVRIRLVSQPEFGGGSAFGAAQG